jgi:Leucine-rich repeat (LRR) protein
MEINTFLTQMDVTFRILSENKIRRIPKDAIINLGSQDRTLSVNLSSNELTDIPEDFLSLTHMTTLHLGANRIGFVHSAAFRLNTALTGIGLETNKLEQLKEGTFNTSSYMSLSLDGNLLKRLAPNLFRKGAVVKRLYVF